MTNTKTTESEKKQFEFNFSSVVNNFQELFDQKSLLLPELFDHNFLDFFENALFISNHVFVYLRLIQEVERWVFGVNSVEKILHFVDSCKQILEAKHE